jgi:prepilin-type N-terminal cleavage/methylation domain-containing protein
MMRKERGFSMVELMVAMTITLIVSGAIYGLLTSGNTAFRREPELADRQQNIRVAMDLISRDVYNAGASLPTYSQAFTRVDPGGGPCTGSEGLNGCGPEGTLGATAANNRGQGDAGGKDASTASDVLEIVSTDERCRAQSACSGTPAVAGTVVLRGRLPSCLGLPGLLLLTDNASFTIQPAVVGTGAELCSGGDAAQNGKVVLTAASLGSWSPAATMSAPSTSPPPATPVVFVYGARAMRYLIAPSGDPRDTVPALWRSASGRYASGGTVTVDPGTAGFTQVGSPWELVARGIEDLQIEYQAGPDATVWTNRPPLVVNTWDSLVRQVRITLSARAQAPNLQGAQRAAGTGPDAVRGQLTTVVVPRQAFNELQIDKQIQ